MPIDYQRLDQLCAAYSSDPDDGELEDSRLLDDCDSPYEVLSLGHDALKRLILLARIGHEFWAQQKIDSY